MTIKNRLRQVEIKRHGGVVIVPAPDGEPVLQVAPDRFQYNGYCVESLKDLPPGRYHVLADREPVPFGFYWDKFEDEGLSWAQIVAAAATEARP